MHQTGEKLKLVNLMDKYQANQLVTTHSIELVLSKSPKQNVKCGAIVVFKLKGVEGIDFSEDADPIKALQVQNEMNSMTDEMLGDPILFKESDGKWLNFALPKVLELFDRYQDCTISIKAPKLKIRHKISRTEVHAKRTNHLDLFRTAIDISILLDEFQYDPWSGVIRRGNIGADK